MPGTLRTARRPLERDLVKSREISQPVSGEYLIVDDVILFIYVALNKMAMGDHNLIRKSDNENMNYDSHFIDI